jgi:hypothetical protein
MKELIRKQLGSVLRTLLAPLGVWLASEYLSADEASQFVSVLGTLILGAAWGAYEKWDTKKKTDAKVETALALPAGATQDDLHKAMSG